MEGDDVFMLELFHEGNFTDGGAGRAFFAVEVDLFEGDEFASLPVATLEDLVVIWRSALWEVGGLAQRGHTVA